MPCTNCGENTPLSFNVQFSSGVCTDCAAAGCGNSALNSQCVFYSGPNLNCSSILTGDSIETVIQKLDEQVCFIAGDYSNYQFHCIPDWYGQNITLESQFVDAITGYACYTNDLIQTFVNSSFPEYNTIVDNRFLAIEVPGITCAVAGVSSTDTLQQVLTKYCSKFVALDNFNSLSGVAWNTCYTVSTTPTTLGAAFNVILNQICQTKALASGASLPTFNNSGSCLTGGTSSDSLITTIGLIKTRLCQTGTFDASALAWGCLDDSSTTLQNSIQTVITQVSTLVENIPTFSNDFVVTLNSLGNPCSGVHVALTTPISQDRFVASNDADTSPATLVHKLAAGTGITISDSTPGVITISSSGTADTYQVKADGVDDAPGYLDAKLTGTSDNGVSVSPVYNAGTKKVDLIVGVDTSDLFNALLDRLLSDSVLYAKFCSRVAACPSPCEAPSNVQVVQFTTTTTIAP